MASPAHDGVRPLKRRRLNHACDRCRTRKIRCDDRQPECGNCLKAKAICTTRDARNHTFVTRHEAQRRPESSVGTPATANSLPSPARRGRLNNSEEQEIDVHPPGHGTAAARLPAFPRFINGNSVYILAQWLDLAFARLNHTFSLSHVFVKSKGQLAAGPPGDGTGQGALSNEHRGKALEQFLATVHCVFTIFPAYFLSHLMSQVHDDATLHCTLSHLIIAVGGNAASRSSLSIAFSNLGVLVQAANLESLAALTLMVIILRGQEDSERALHILSIASSIAHTLGLHRRTPSFNEEHISLWWTLYALDKALAIELERPIIIKSQDCDQQRPADGSMLSAIVELACIQEVIVERMFQERHVEESPDQTLQEIIVHKMRMAGELDTMLLEWHATLAMSMRPAEHLFCEEEDLPAVSYLALQYFQTAFLVHRNSLITNRRHVRSIADSVFVDEAYRLRLRNGPFICYGIAKSIITVLGRTYDTYGLSILNSVHAPLIAAIGLAIHIFKHANSSAVKADLEVRCRSNPSSQAGN